MAYGGLGTFFAPGNEIGVILVLFILLVVIACSCGAFGGGYAGGAV
ncbi:sporulation protein YjcZ [Aneurinibacillus terranovensis]|nr:sporulation protein YjcZ [Aneurinibacillus terranovensis]